MKRVMFRVFVGLCFGLFIVVSLIGCGRKISSQGEAIYEASQLPDFGKLISIDSIYSTGGIFFADTMRILDSEVGHHDVIHIVVYEKKDGNVSVIRFDEQRPPKIITVKKKSG